MERTTPDVKRRGALKWALWEYHRERCGCRATDGQRCSLARQIKALGKELDRGYWAQQVSRVPRAS